MAVKPEGIHTLAYGITVHLKSTDRYENYLSELYIRLNVEVRVPCLPIFRTLLSSPTTQCSRDLQGQDSYKLSTDDILELHL